jgi:hypothetical protein
MAHPRGRRIVVRKRKVKRIVASHGNLPEVNTLELVVV